MKIWNGYGSEHSMNLVLIGKFKRAQDAEKVEKDIDKLSAQAAKDDSYSIPFAKPENQRFSDEMLSLLCSLNLNTLGSVRKVQTGRIGAMTGWRPAWQSVTNSRMQLGS